MHPELESEQAYVDHAYACLEEMRRQVERAGDAGIGEVEALVIEAWAAKRLVTFEDAERGLCLGRLDLDGVVRPLYVGRRWVHERQTPIVVNWQAPAARPFYTATVAAPQGVALRRRFRTEGAGCSTSTTSRSTAPPETSCTGSRTSCSRSSSAAATSTCVTSSRPSRRTSTA